jgi:hypothetical protein
MLPSRCSPTWYQKDGKPNVAGWNAARLRAFRAIELITGSQPLTGASTQFNPGAGGQKRFWLKAQAYDHNDIPIKTVDLFGCLYADSLQFGNEVARCKMNFESIYSTKQSGVISA